MSARGTGRGGNPSADAALATAKSPEEAAKIPGLAPTLAVAAAWSPSPKDQPLYLDLATKDGQVQQDVVAKWAANAPWLLSTNTSAT